MAHYQQLKFVGELSAGLPNYFVGKKVLEIGSWDVNGSIRSMFKDCDYLGADVAEGPGVDLVCKGEAIQLPDATFDVTISCECFEHNPAWKETFGNMIRMLKPAGLCVVTCATLGRSEHGTRRTNPDASLTALENYPDYYQNLKRADFEKNFALSEIFTEYFFALNPYSKDLYFVGIKKGVNFGVKPLLRVDTLKRIREIRREKPTGLITRCKRNIKFFYRYALASLLGESAYHNLMHRPPRRK
jgi:SAM-dependent methyltransferase